MQKVIANILMLAAATLMISWPHVLNGYPTIFMDTVPFFVSGRKTLQVTGAMPKPSAAVAATAAREDAPAAGATPTPKQPERSGIIRSPFYGTPAMAIATATGSWGAVAVVQALWLAAALLLALPWLGVISRDARLVAIALLSLFSALPFFAHVLIADVFAGLVPLGVALLVIFGGRMSQPERWFWLITLFGVGLFHPAFAIHGYLLLLVLLPWLWRGEPALRRNALIAAAAIVPALLLNLVLPTVIGRLNPGSVAPPFLLSRAIGDGTAGKVLREACPASHRVSCSFLPGLPMTGDQFLWESRAVTPWVARDPAERLAINAEELPILLDVLMRYPGEQLGASLGNTARQFVSVELDEFRDSDRLRASMAASGFGAEYQRFHATPAAATAPAHQYFAGLWTALYLLSVVVLGGLLAARLFAPGRLSRAVPRDLAAFAAIILVSLVLSAAVNGTLSGVFGRYQGRVSWLAPLALGSLGWALVRTRRPSPAMPATD